MVLPHSEIIIVFLQYKQSHDDVVMVRVCVSDAGIIMGCYLLDILAYIIKLCFKSELDWTIFIVTNRSCGCATVHSVHVGALCKDMEIDESRAKTAPRTSTHMHMNMDWETGMFKLQMEWESWDLFHLDALLDFTGMYNLNKDGIKLASDEKILTNWIKKAVALQARKTTSVYQWFCCSVCSCLVAHR